MWSLDSYLIMGANAMRALQRSPDYYSALDIAGRARSRLIKVLS